jgi:hypothetical protein
MMVNKYILIIITVFTFIFRMLVLSSFAQEQTASDVSILESRFSTTEPTVGETFKYFLKFDSKDGVNIYLVEHFAENGLTIVEQKSLEPQKFQGRVIQQYEYTLSAQQEGERRFSPVALNYAGPRQNPVAAQAESIQITVSPIVDVQVMTNSPIMLNEMLALSLAVIKRKPVTITSMPPTLEAVLQVSAQPDIAKQKESSPQTPTPSPEPPPALRFELDQSQKIAPQQTADGKTVEQYKYKLAVPPKQAGEYVIPAITVTYRTATGEEIQTSTKPTSIFVMNPNTGNLGIQTDYRFLTLPAIVLAAMILAGLAVLLFLKYRKPRSREKTVVEPPLPPGELAHRELAAIQALKLPAKGEFKRYYTLVSESVRKFLGAEFGFPVLERTTEEVLHDIHKRDVPARVRERTGKFLQDADLVKFAKYTPLLEEADTAMEQAIKIVDESVEYHRVKAAEVMKEHVGGAPEMTIPS